MQNDELINALLKFNGGLDIRAIDSNGVLYDIDGVLLKTFIDKYGNEYESLALAVGGRSEDKVIEDQCTDEDDSEYTYEYGKDTDVESDKFNVEFDLSPLFNKNDEEFIKNVNKELPEEDKIDKDDAANAKPVFYEDAMHEEYQYEFDKRYGQAVKEAMMELFGDTTPLDELSLSKAIRYINKNGWSKELKGKDITDSSVVYPFLYEKLAERVEEKYKYEEQDEEPLELSIDEMVEQFIKGFDKTFKDFLSNIH